MFRIDQSAIANHSHQTTRRVGAAAESENIYIIAGFVMFGEKLIALDNVDLEAGPDRAANELIIPFGSDALVVPFHLLGAVRRLILYRLVKPAHVGFHPAG